MKIKTLRYRLILVTAVIVTVTSTLFAGGLLLIKQQLEEATFGKIVSRHVNILLDDPDQADSLNNPLLNEWQYYRGSNIEALPQRVQTLPTGSYHSIKLHRQHYHLQIVEDAGEKVFLLYDISEWEQQEHTLLMFLLSGMIIVLIVAVYLASKAADSVLAPVRRLTQRLTELSPKQRGVRIEAEFGDSDISQIAAAVDSYLERIDQFVDRERSFTAAASHELRTPLSVMIGAVDIIEADCPQPATQRAVTRIRRACSEMLAFIEAALFLSREEDRTINEGGPCNVGKVIEQLIADLQGDIDAAHIALSTQIRDGLTVQAPESLVKIMLSNLLRNAIEHSHRGNIELRSDSHSLEIRDTGSGIPEADLPLIFDRSYTTKPGGTGLGLDLVKRICDRYGWAIDISSETGNGTSVKLRF
ncbi:HAMP domain-containing histidine kinase [Spongiibacter nanhainus]|uniref:histidine kinase n=1 Tax=Spongiibacter nanhainus TaxID=2794344 RepID=A0A7T4R1B8_9GAMM|nr:HAMP domain-containing sensor histidine kinase [Spongiibacter nanhainus]QQD18595.1 HAMP domain-containing histidine kinase [Spongiibacter nanhainus]